MIDRMKILTPRPIRPLLRTLFRTTYKLGVVYVRSRYEFAHILNARNLTGEGAEIGVQHGSYSATLLRDWRGKKLYSVDPWKEFEQSEYTDRSNVTQREQEAVYREAVQSLAPFGVRSEVIRATSLEASKSFREGQFDFVYIDAQHHYEAVMQDLELWYPKVREGGILAGHDYVDGLLDAGMFGVRSAVDEFASRNRLKVLCSAEIDWPSWCIFL